MRVRNNGALLALALIAIAESASAQFSAGTLAVSRVGDGSAALNTAAWAAFLDSYSTSGAFNSSTAMRTTASGAQLASTNSGTATSELQLNLSGDGKSLTIGGYNVAAGTAGVAATTAARVIDTISLAGTVDSSTSIGSLFSASNIRTVWSPDGNGFYAGGPLGLVYDTLGGSSGVQLLASTNIRQVQGVGGNLFYTTAAAGKVGLWEISGMPTSGTVTPTQVLSTASSDSPYDFLFANNGNTLYVADDGAATGDIQGGIQKYTLSGGLWSQAYVGLATGFTGVRSLTSDGTKIYGIGVTSTGLDELISTTDTGTGFGAFSLLATPGTNENFRGVRFIPPAAPEPASVALLGLAVAGIVARRRARE